jgi:hypothetical protein
VIKRMNPINPSPAPRLQRFARSNAGRLPLDRAGNILQGGYVAIATVLVVGFVMLSVGIGVTMNSINEIQSSFAETQKEESIGFVESCVQEALLDLNKTDAIPASIVLPDGTCAVTINSHVGNSWDFSVTGTYLGYKKNMRVTAIRASTVSVTSWIEI